MTHLCPKQEYIDRYDRITVEECRRQENFHKNYKMSDEDNSANHKSAAGLVRHMSSYYALFGATLHWWEKKEKVINEWMDADRRRDEMLAVTRAPENIRCLKCRASLKPSTGHIHELDGKEHVLFFYTCPSGCLPNRAVFDNGKEYEPKPHLCPKCQTKLEEKHERIKDEKIMTASTCPSCDYTDTYELELGDREEVPDPDYATDRVRFCLTDEQGKKALVERFETEQAGKFADKLKEEDEHKEDYEAVKKIQQLTVIELEKLLAPILEKVLYIRLQFGTPMITKDVFLPFTIYDSKSGRNDRESTYNLAQAIKKALAPTNWRLMSDGRLVPSWRPYGAITGV